MMMTVEQSRHSSQNNAASILPLLRVVVVTHSFPSMDVSLCVIRILSLQRKGRTVTSYDSLEIDKRWDKQ